MARSQGGVQAIMNRHNTISNEHELNNIFIKKTIIEDKQMKIGLNCCHNTRKKSEKMKQFGYLVSMITAMPNATWRLKEG